MSGSPVGYGEQEDCDDVQYPKHAKLDWLRISPVPGLRHCSKMASSSNKLKNTFGKHPHNKAMQRFLNKDLAAKYKSPSQKIRVLTESWVSEEIFCPSCGASIGKYAQNRPVADFYCSICKEDYELKSKGNSIGSRIVDGAFKTAVERTKSNHNPNLFLLAYDTQDYEVLNFLVIPNRVLKKSLKVADLVCRIW